MPARTASPFLAGAHPPASSETIVLDRGSLEAPRASLTRRQRLALRAFFKLPLPARHTLFFACRPWCLPAQLLLQHVAGGAAELEVRYASGPLQGRRFAASTAERYFLEGANYELGLHRPLRDLVAPGSVAFDVGAHAGYWALALAAMTGPRGRVVALEPSPRNFRRLTRNLELNRHAPDAAPITALNLAAGERRGSLTLHQDGVYTHLAGPSRQRADPADAVTVEVCSLDELVFTEGHPAPAVVLLDVEGWAGRVLMGARRLLRERSPAILVEVHTERERAEINSALSCVPYTFTEFRTTGWPIHLLARAAA